MKICLLRPLVSIRMSLVSARCTVIVLTCCPTDAYECSGNVEIDFPGLCAFLDMKYIPSVNTKKPASSTPEGEAEDSCK